MAIVALLKGVAWSLRYVLLLAIGVVQLIALAHFCMRAYRIRLHAVKEFGMIIHEFDPWFNYRAAEYLAQHGSDKFFKWYDYMSWYPIGRPIGTTIYPGMQFAAVWLWELFKHVPAQVIDVPWRQMGIPKWVDKYLPNEGKALSIGPMSVNDTCVMVPAWFGSLTTVIMFLMTRELSESTSAGLVAAFFMAIIPAHIMRTYAGEFENEAVAVACFCATIWLWALSIRTNRHWPFGILAGLAYYAAAATWGGYIFINNLIALHAAVLVVLGKRRPGLYKAFTLYYIVGTYLAMRIPVIGWAPLRALEQMPSVLVFGTYQMMQLCDIYRERYGKKMNGWQFFRFRVQAFAAVAMLAFVVAYILMLRGVFMPLGARIRGLFLEAVKTGNPLVDSVAEHQPASKQAYDHYLSWARYVAAVGLLFCWHQATPAKFLVVLYALVAYHYSLKMSRLLIICGPIVSCLAGYPVGILFDWCLEQALGLLFVVPGPPKVDPVQEKTGGMGSIMRTVTAYVGPLLYCSELADVVAMKEKFRVKFAIVDRPLRAAVAAAIVYSAYQQSAAPVQQFMKHCEQVAAGMSNPHLMFKSRTREGKSFLVKDYYDGYIWLKENTPEDARVMAWWDYGYQITGVANRTSIADGNTWNHEHIATLGRVLTSTERKSWNAQRHLTDYTLVWAGGRGDDMGKSPHLARIGNSVFPDHCGDEDPMCTKFSFYRDGTPTEMMANSFLYKAVNHNLKEGVKLSGKYFKEVHTTKYGLMRIYKVMNVSQESKDWVADPKNRVCDAPGSWYCVGQYPPALKPLIDSRRNFAQLEDFNKGGGQKSAYTRHIEAERQRR
mmetsp:Transcript_73088/g.136594  ORF Transcript_73088/g.136594 Transcript_73088/m.136594 type:complete len:831 (-) Transcript_73088:81-2573(-)